MEGANSIKWDYGRQNHIPNIKNGFEWAKRELGGDNPNLQTITILVYLMALRQWVNYEDGKSVKENLETALTNITWLYLTQTEY